MSASNLLISLENMPFLSSRVSDLKVVGVGIANGGGTISDMFHPSERA